MQPYFLPYLGYWQLIKAVDKFVVYDDVTYIKGGWINRNKLLIAGEKKLFTISLVGASSFKFINEITIGDDFSRLMKTIQINYAKAPYFRQAKDLIEAMVRFESRNLAEFIANSFRVILDYLDIGTELLISSSLKLGFGLKGQDRVMSICESLRASEYYNAIGGQKLYNKSEFSSHGIRLSFLKTNNEIDKQFGSNFVPDLSILHVLMFYSPERVTAMLNNYELV